MINLRRLITLVLFILPGLSNGQTAPKWYPEMKTMVDERIAQNLFVDGAMGVISNQSPEAETAVFGKAKLDTIFEIGSITKAFTGIMFAQMVLENTLGASDTVAKFIPELAGTFAGSITLEDLATHKSGLARLPEDIVDGENPYATYNRQQLVSYLKTAQPTNEPKPDYSNTGTALLGEILAIADGVTYAELLEKRITKPLGMNDTSLKVADCNKDRFIDGYDLELKVVMHWDFDVFSPTGAIRSTINDMLKFIKLNLRPDNSTLAQAMQLSQKNHWGWDTELIGFPFPYKNGGTAGFSSAMFIDHGRKTAAIILTNIAYEADSFIIPILKANNP